MFRNNGFPIFRRLRSPALFTDLRPQTSDLRSSTDHHPFHRSPSLPPITGPSLRSPPFTINGPSTDYHPFHRSPALHLPFTCPSPITIPSTDHRSPALPPPFSRITSAVVGWVEPTMIAPAFLPSTWSIKAIGVQPLQGETQHKLGMLGNQRLSPDFHSRAIARGAGKRNTAEGCTCRDLLGYAL